MAMKFINPYNFIPFNSAVEPEKRKRDGELFTGSIEYTLLTKTPLIIPNTSNNNIFGYRNNNAKEFHKSYEFFSYEDLSDIEGSEAGKQPVAPVIPGSEIRGMFRSNYEIITDSCLSFLTTDQILHKRVAGFFKPGLIKKNGSRYDLYEARDCLLRTQGANNLDTSDQNYDKNNPANSIKYNRQSYIQNNFTEGQRVYVFEQARDHKCKSLIIKINDKKTATTPTEGYIIKGMPGPESMKGKNQNKHCAHVFIDTMKKVDSNIDISKLDSTLNMYEKNDSNPYPEYRREWNAFKSSDGASPVCFPVYYSRNNDNIYLSPASGTMETYKSKIDDLVNKKCSCKDTGSLCPACSLFGTINDKGDGVSSRVRFSDLKLNFDDKDKELFEKTIMLQELSSPKLQNMEFYLKRPDGNAQFWTYEYWIDNKGKIHEYKNGEKAELNGRKFYWHSKKVAPPAMENNDRNITTRPLNSGIRFTGKVFFEKITKKELLELIWLVNCGRNEEISSKKYGYKLGHAKPLGYGSIAVNVDKVMIRSVIKKNDRVDVVYADQTEELSYESRRVFDESPIKSGFEIMTDFDYLEKNAKGIELSYPKVNSPANPIYEWFVGNHGKHVQPNNKFPNGSLEYPSNDNYHSNDKKTVMPSSKTEMCFREYMEPLEPVLMPTNVSKDNNSVANTSGKNSPKPIQHENRDKDYHFELFKKYKFRVIGYDKGKDGKLSYVKLALSSNETVVIKIPFTILEKAKNKGDCATIVKKGIEYMLIYKGSNSGREWGKA